MTWKEGTATGDSSAHFCFFQSMRGREYRHAVCLKGSLSRLFQLEKGLDLDDCSVVWLKLKVPIEDNSFL